MRNAKTAPDYWWSMFDRPVDRRGALRAMGNVFGLMALSAAPACSVRAAPSRVRLTGDPFEFGVASGDPTSTGAVLWTRLAGDVLRESGMLQTPVPVRWEVAADPAFRHVVAFGDREARPELGYSVHIEADGLAPGSDYWYRFRLGDADSSTGRTRTAPPGADFPFRFAFASCQNYEHGHFTCLRHLADEDVDLVVHLGDYIYESRFSSPDPLPREHESGEVITLEQYRSRYATYRRDPDLRRAHESAPWLVTFDDHEVDNNWAGSVPEDAQSPEAFLLRRAAAFQAYYEFMPLRASARPAGPSMRLYRQVPFGGLGTFFVLDGRQFRTDQPCGDGRQVRCPGALDPNATMLGASQEAWLFDALARSRARWNILANQVMVSALAQESPEGLNYSMDRWDGYVAAQNR
ncbi:MAG: alkaline phosphatase, partial [Gemmatimonadetes bacterium]|nr:alkaline phosphatase [Gemmatimonadota bacterium]